MPENNKLLATYPLDKESIIAAIGDGVAHAFVNACSTAVNLGEAMRLGPEGATPDELAEYSTRLLEAAWAASEISQRFTGFLAANTPNVMGEVRFDALAQACVERLRSRSPGTVEWQLDLAPSPPFPADPERTRCVIELIVQNAIEAVETDGGVVTLRTRVDGIKGHVLDIENTGPNMPKAVYQRAAEPFFTTKEGHLGLGLTLARMLWRRQEGSFIMMNLPESGVRIQLALPKYLASSGTTP